MVYSLPYSFGPGEVARPQEVNANFNAIINQLETINTSKADIDLSNITSDGIDNIKSTSISKNIGEIVFSTIPLNDSSLHLLDGSIINPEGIYNDFCTYIRRLYYENESANYFTTEANWQSSVSSYGVCAKFVYDSENNTVRLPKITGIIEGITDENVLGNLVQAGLPNITGAMNIWKSGEEIRSKSGALSGSYTASASNAAHSGNSEDANLYIDFKASNSNSIYGKSSTVQPQTVKILYYIVVATSAKIDIQVDIDDIATDLNGKADVDFTNANNTAKILMSKMGMPSNSSKNLTVPTSGQTVTATSNGYFCLSGVAASASHAHVTLQKGNFTSRCSSFSSGTANHTFLPAKKGDAVTVNYSNISSSTLRFIYAVGSESEA